MYGVLHFSKIIKAIHKSKYHFNLKLAVLATCNGLKDLRPILTLRNGYFSQFLQDIFHDISKTTWNFCNYKKKQKNQCKMLYAIGTICISYLGCGGPQNSEIVFPRAIICCFIDEISLLSHFLFVIDQF